jgi:hypothetical protein
VGTAGETSTGVFTPAFTGVFAAKALLKPGLTAWQPEIAKRNENTSKNPMGRDNFFKAHSPYVKLLLFSPFRGSFLLDPHISINRFGLNVKYYF